MTTNETKKIELILKCIEHLGFASQENLKGYDSEMLELKLLHLSQVIGLTMKKVADLYEIEKLESEERREVQKIEDEIIKEKYPISWDEVDERREKAKKKTLDALTKPLSEGAKKKYEAAHMKSGKAPPKDKKTGFTEKRFKQIHIYRQMIKEIDAEAHPSQLGKVLEIMEYFEHVRKYRGTIKKTLKQLKLGSNKYYTWKKRLESGFKYNPKKSKKYISCVACKTTETPQWRKYKDGIYCNACGIKKYRKGLKKKNRGKK